MPEPTAIPTPCVPHRRTLLGAAGLLATGLVPFIGRARADVPPMPTEPVPGANHDFDFLIGSWRVEHRQLKERLAGSTEWITFPGTCVMQAILGGQGTFDDNVVEKPGHAYRGATLRIFDPEKREWAIYWFDARFPAQLDPPVRGGFLNGTGRFLADDTFQGRPIKVRFLWQPQTATTCHWEQAFSPDGGRTWETNWFSDFTRVT